ncbi:MAG: hypothetical protein VW600_03710, partial [Ferrovibrio sp.]
MLALSKSRVVAWTAAALGICVVSLATMPVEAQPMRRPGMQPGGMQQDGAQPGAPGGMQGGPRGEGAPQGGPPRTENEVPRWIDTHVHLVSGVTNTTGDWPGAVRAAIADMDKNNIGLAFVMPTPQPPGTTLYDIADFADAVKRHPGRFAKNIPAGHI